jgi:hypothetical protein
MDENTKQLIVMAVCLVALSACIRGCFIEQAVMENERLRIERACPAPSPKAGAH